MFLCNISSEKVGKTTSEYIQGGSCPPTAKTAFNRSLLVTYEKQLSSFLGEKYPVFPAGERGFPRRTPVDSCAPGTPPRSANCGFLKFCSNRQI